MDKRKGFTLIELLVVIAIIALLMSILIPALAKAKNLAKAAMCKSNLHTWSIGFALATDDNDGRFPGGDAWWANEVGKDYLKNKEKLCLCPMATKTFNEGGRVPFMAFEPSNEKTYTPISYGFNEWCTTESRGGFEGWNKMTAVKGAAMVPVFGDMCDTNENRAEGQPLQRDIPGEYDGAQRGSGLVNEMRMFCTNRHDGAIKFLFLDWSVRRVGLKGLWNLRWHRGYPIGADKPDWPAWMAGFSDKIY